MGEDVHDSNHSVADDKASNFDERQNEDDK